MIYNNNSYGTQTTTEQQKEQQQRGEQVADSGKRQEVCECERDGVDKAGPLTLINLSIKVASR